MISNLTQGPRPDRAVDGPVTGVSGLDSTHASAVLIIQAAGVTPRSEWDQFPDPDAELALFLLACCRLRGNEDPDIAVRRDRFKAFVQAGSVHGCDGGCC